MRERRIKVVTRQIAVLYISIKDGFLIAKAYCVKLTKAGIPCKGAVNNRTSSAISDNIQRRENIGKRKILYHHPYLLPQ